MLLPNVPPLVDAVPVASSSAVRQILVTPFSTTLDTAQDTGLQADVDAGEVCFVNALLCVDAPAGGMKFAIDCPAGSTIEGWIYTTGAALTSFIRTRVTAIDTLTASIAATVRGSAIIWLRIVVGPTDGTVKLQACSTTATQTTLIDTGSMFELYQGATEV